VAARRLDFPSLLSMLVNFHQMNAFIFVSQSVLVTLILATSIVRCPPHWSALVVRHVSSVLAA
jgi:hypothetical protein